MYFCTPTFDPYEGLASTLQMAYPKSQVMHVVSDAARSTIGTPPVVRSADSAQALVAAA